MGGLRLPVFTSLGVCVCVCVCTVIYRTTNSWLFDHISTGAVCHWDITLHCNVKWCGSAQMGNSFLPVPNLPKYRFFNQKYRLLQVYKMP